MHACWVLTEYSGIAAVNSSSEPSYKLYDPTLRERYCQVTVDKALEVPWVLKSGYLITLHMEPM